MIIALYIPEELADSYRKERFQPTLEKFKRWARQGGTPADLRIARQLEASFCVSRQIVKGNGAVPLVGPSFPESEWDLKNLKESKNMKTLQMRAIVECDNCGAKYYLHDDNTPKLPKLHRVCGTCFLPMETVNPLYEFQKELI